MKRITTPAALAAVHTADEIETMSGMYSRTGLSYDELAEFDVDDDMTADALTETLESAFESWYDREYEPRPDYTPADLAHDLILYRAWQIADREEAPLKFTDTFSNGVLTTRRRER